MENKLFSPHLINGWKEYGEIMQKKRKSESGKKGLKTFIFKFGLDFHFFNTFLYGSTF